MTIEMDQQHGRAVGSKITLRGRILSLSLKVEELVTQYDVPRAKAWKLQLAPEQFVKRRQTLGIDAPVRVDAMPPDIL